MRAWFEQQLLGAFSDGGPIDQHHGIARFDAYLDGAYVPLALRQLLLCLRAHRLLPGWKVREVEAEVLGRVAVATQLELDLAQAGGDGGVLSEVPGSLKSLTRAFEVILGVASRGCLHQLCH